MSSSTTMSYSSALKLIRSFRMKDKVRLVNELDKEIQLVNRVIYKKINYLLNQQLKEPLDVTVELDENVYLAKSIDFPLYATGGTIEQAVNNLGIEIEELYRELNGGSDFSDEWLKYKEMLN